MQDACYLYRKMQSYTEKYAKKYRRDSDFFVNCYKNMVCCAVNEEKTFRGDFYKAENILGYVGELENPVAIVFKKDDYIGYIEASPQQAGQYYRTLVHYIPSKGFTWQFKDKMTNLSDDSQERADQCAKLQTYIDEHRLIKYGTGKKNYGNHATLKDAYNFIDKYTNSSCFLCGIRFLC